MKKLLFLLIVIGSTLPFATKASHMAGAEIWYEYTGDSLNPYNYRIWLQFYRDVSGIQAPTNPALCITNACLLPPVSGSFTMAPFVLQYPCNPSNPGTDTCYGQPGAIRIPANSECVDITSGGTYVQTEIYRYYADVTLTGQCGQWTFSFHENARNSNDNLSTPGTLLTEAKLNNLLGPDNSPVFKTSAIRSFCINSPSLWKHRAEDQDGDSLYYSLAQPLEGDCFGSSPEGYKPGYSITQPISTTNGLTMDHSNGTLLFTPSQPEVVVVKVAVTSYRYDPLLQIWIPNGYITRDVETSIMSACSSTSLNWGLEAQPDSLIQLFCGDSTITLRTTMRYLAATLAEDASDFAIINSDSNLLPIVEAAAIGTNGNGESHEILLRLHQPVSYNDTLVLISRTGTDGNTLTSVCGIDYASLDTVGFYVSDCLDTTTSALRENQFSTFEIYPNPARSEITLTYANASSKRRVSILSSSGQLILSQTAALKEVQLDIVQLPPGVYLLQSSDDSSTEVRRFIKN